MISKELKQAAKILILKGAQRVQEDVRERAEKRAEKKAQEKAEEKQREEFLAEQQRLWDIICYLSDAVATVLKPGSYGFFLENIYAEKEFENNGNVWTEPVVVDTVRIANVYTKPLVDVKNSDVFAVAIYGNISEDDMIALTDYFRHVPNYEYKRVGILVSGLAKELVFCATNDADDYTLINRKLSSRDETKV